MNITYNTTLANKKQVVDLFLSTGWNDEYQLTAEELYAGISNSWYMVSAFDEEKLVGIGRIISDGNLHALIVDMIVLPDYKNQKIGSTILTMLIDHCKKHKIADVQLFCATGVSPFYQKHGFIPRKSEAPGMDLKKD